MRNGKLNVPAALCTMIAVTALTWSSGGAATGGCYGLDTEDCPNSYMTCISNYDKMECHGAEPRDPDPLQEYDTTKTVESGGNVETSEYTVDCPRLHICVDSADVDPDVLDCGPMGSVYTQASEQEASNPSGAAC